MLRLFYASVCACSLRMRLVISMFSMVSIIIIIIIIIMNSNLQAITPSSQNKTPFFVVSIPASASLPFAHSSRPSLVPLGSPHPSLPFTVNVPSPTIPKPPIIHSHRHGHRRLEEGHRDMASCRFELRKKPPGVDLSTSTTSAPSRSWIWAGERTKRSLFDTRAVKLQRRRRRLRK